MAVKVKGVKETVRGFDKFDARFQADLLKTTERSLFSIERSAKEKAPVLRGFLRNRIKAKITKVTDLVISGIVESGAPYSFFVEMGHRLIPGTFVARLGRRIVAAMVRARPFLFPALEDNFGKIRGFFQKMKVR